MSHIRVRFAPSPTGYLHLGNARSALFNWLWARQKKGHFILRMEDTDQERSSVESSRIVLESLRWLQLDWDEGPEVGGPNGPYFQSERLGLYKEFSERLIQQGHAYRCYCTKEELDRAREQQKKRGIRDAYRYPGTCRNRTDHPDRPYVVRFRAPESGCTRWNDLVKGPIEVQHETLQDFVLLRSNGLPLYNLGAAIDDITMGITLVARGDDHMINTTPQILIFQALGYPTPTFAHLPMILAPNGDKLSKRHAAVAVLDYREQGYLPDAVLNYLARLGWSHGDQEIFTRQQLIDCFNWEHVGRTAAKFDTKKFLFVQQSHQRLLDDAFVGQAAWPFLGARGLQVDRSDARLEKAVGTIRIRARTLVEAAEMMDFYFREPPRMDPQAKADFLTPEIAPKLVALAETLSRLESFDERSLQSAVTRWLEEERLQLKEIAQPARVALTGKRASPGLFEVMQVLGQEVSVKRLRQAAALAGEAS
ncbi:MAG: glutamate--tRNA ligase [Deltaproteobacteria bacterium]|nr:glutamate--tRNA ligase [Deltaproteobacteria bacterium]